MESGRARPGVRSGEEALALERAPAVARRRLDGRWIAAAVLAFVAAYGAVAARSAPGWAHGWRAIGVPSMGPAAAPVPFGDSLYLVAIRECHLAGFDVLAENPCDPWGRTLTYPRIWLRLLAPLPLTRELVVPIGVSFAALFFVATFRLLGPLAPIEGLFVGLLLASRAVLLGVERGNGDLLLFVLLAAAVRALERDRPALPAYATFAAVGLLKYFPAAGLAAAARESGRRFAAIVGTAVAGFALYLALTWDDLGRMRSALEQITGRSFGAPVLAEIVRRRLAAADLAPSPEALAAGYLGVLAVVAGLAIHRGLRAAPDSAPGRIDGFRAGASIYLAHYALLGSFDYKQICLLLALPRMLAWARGEGAVALRARAALGALLATCWMSDWHREFLLGELLNLVLAAYLLHELVRTRPDWLPNSVRR
jgi:hypothetical protein